MKQLLIKLNNVLVFLHSNVVLEFFYKELMELMVGT